MPPISELTVTRNLVEPAGASRRMGHSGYSEGEDAFIVYRGGATGRPQREQHLHQRHRAQRHRELRSAEPSQLQAESPRAARER